MLVAPCPVVAPIRSRDPVAARLAVAAAGIVPVTLIAATAFGVASLRTLASLVLLPVMTLVTVVAPRRRELVRSIGLALACGIVATLLYDVFRFGFIAFGWTSHDPIPHIGDALGLQPAWVFGYLWRYLGNGGGLAVAFVTLGFRGARAGVLFGLLVCAGLIVTLIASPYGEQMLFPLSPMTILMATGGHLIYGATLGSLAARVTSTDLQPAREADAPRSRRTAAGLALLACFALATACGQDGDSGGATPDAGVDSTFDDSDGGDASSGGECSLVDIERVEELFGMDLEIDVAEGFAGSELCNFSDTAQDTYSVLASRIEVDGEAMYAESVAGLTDASPVDVGDDAVVRSSDGDFGGTVDLFAQQDGVYVTVSTTFGPEGTAAAAVRACTELARLVL